MAELFRSAEMSYLQVIMPEEYAHSFAHYLAMDGCAQITDLNSDIGMFQRRFTKEIMRITELERKNNYMESVLIESKIPYLKLYELDSEFTEPRTDLLNLVEVFMERNFNELAEVSKVVSDLESSIEQAEEFQHVLIQTGRLLKHNKSTAKEHLTEMLQNQVHISDNEAQSVGFSYIAGVVSKEQRVALEKQAFYSSRGNAYCIFSDLKKTEKEVGARLKQLQDLNEEKETESNSNDDDSKNVFIIFFLGSHLRRKLTRLCESLGVRLYLYPENSSDLQNQIISNAKHLDELGAVCEKTRHQKIEVLENISQRLSVWKRSIIQEKAIFTTLNKMKVHSRNFIIEMWAPSKSFEKVEDAMNKAADGKGVARPIISELETHVTPPTYFPVDDFSSTFQQIVNTYGVPRYQEVNPALFAIVTFPFLFGIMYGDIGHGSFLFAFGLYLILNEKSYKKAAREGDETAASLIGARYLLFFMGAFAVYVGFIYNDCMSMSINLFGSKYLWPETDVDGVLTASRTGGVYPFGVDPAWHDTTSELAFYNSLKMKLSVVIGIIQMTFGLILSLYNHLHFKNWINIYCEFIPQMVFMLSFFGYMIVLIITKWSIDWSIPYINGLNIDGTPCLADPPNLITTLINMVLNVGVVECKSLLYEGQAQIQSTLLSFAFLSVPWMLLPKPLMLYFYHWQNETRKQMIREEEGRELLDVGGSQEHLDAHEEHPFEFGEICIHQMIHTIEFVLGTVSNTASYLRLWALSLAHAELAKVFFEKLMAPAWETGNPIAIVIGFGAFMGITFAVLLCMDVLECFLHALRLHWVEFQNKFYAADGYAFQPFSYEAAIAEDAAK